MNRQKKNFHPVEINSENLHRISKDLNVPQYNRKNLVQAIAHIGVGGFHRSHQAYYLDTLLRASQCDWSITGIGVTSHDQRMAEVMEVQDGLYTLLTCSHDSQRAQIIGSITGYRHFPEGGDQVCRYIAENDFKIISLTITEKGYFFTGEQRNLDWNNNLIAHDLENPHNPQSVVGILFRVAQLRIKQSKKLPTFLSCDNIPVNGSVLRKLILQYGEKVDPDTASVIAQSGCFPNCMVDRITPVTQDHLKKKLRDEFGVDDRWPVMCEDYIQWVIEDNFSDGRPPWQECGAMFVDDVEPYERMKIRLLNGSHEALAYISFFLGYREVDRAMADKDISSFVQKYMAEIDPSVGQIPNIDIKEYQKILIKRFSNPAVKDQVLRLTEDSSSRIPHMILEPVSELLESGHKCPYAAFALAAWIRFFWGTDLNGDAIIIIDPRMDDLQKLALNCRDSVRLFLEESGLFPHLIIHNTVFIKEMDMWYKKIIDNPRQALVSLLEVY